MLTNSQLLKGSRKVIHKKFRVNSPRLAGSPQKRATCLKVYTISPKKPNSAVRKIAKVKLSTGEKTLVYLPGQGHTLQQHSVILIRGGKIPDCPGISYRAVRGKYDFSYKEIFERKTNRSKYGTPLFKKKLKK
jgi:small subunit ribosomal protein S12